MAIVLAHVAAIGIALYLIAFHLPLLADFSYLLPQDAPSVVDLRKLEARVKATDIVMVVIQAKTPAERAATAREVAAAIRKLPPELVGNVEEDDADVRNFLRAHRHLFVPYDDLVNAKTALEHRLKAGKLKANPLYIELDE